MKQFDKVEIIQWVDGSTVKIEFDDCQVDVSGDTLMIYTYKDTDSQRISVMQCYNMKELVGYKGINNKK